MSGYVPYVDIDIIVTGLRPGEKLYEELLLDEEGIQKTSHNSIYVGKPVPPTPVLAEILRQGGSNLESMIDEITKGSDEEVIAWLHQVVPNYQNGNGQRQDPAENEG